MRITATTYFDFLINTGIARVRVVREARRLYEEYSQGADFYRRLRERIIRFHRNGEDLSVLDDLVAEAPPRNRQSYRACVKGYRRWIRKKGIIWAGRPRPEVWTGGGLEVVLNPELLLNVDGKRHRVKLYFKEAKLSQRRANLLIHLLKTGVSDGAKVAVLDVRRGRLLLQTATHQDLDLVLQAEALSFDAMWKAVGEAGGERPQIA